MRNGLLMLVLAAVAAGLLVLVLRQDGGEGTEDLLQADRPPSDEPSRPVAPAPKPREPLVVVGEAEWPARVEDEENFQPLPMDPRIARIHIETGHEDGWHATGRQILELLARELPADLQMRFRTQDELEAFRKADWPEAVPIIVPLVQLLEGCLRLGYRPMLDGDGVYLVRLR